MLRTLACVLFVPCACLAAEAPQEPESQEVVVTSTRLWGPLDPWAERVRVIDREALEAWSGAGLAEVLMRAGLIDVARRGAAQADLGLRGAGFEQVLVLVDGVPVNDPQTGHHNLDLPLTADDIERIEILPGVASAVWGAGAVGGVVQVITRHGQRAGQTFRAAGGSFSSSSAGASLAANTLGAGGGWAAAGRGSIAMERNAGHRPGTESSALTATQGALFIHPGGATWTRVAYADRRFGADGFYGPWPSEEHTRSLLAMARSRIDLPDGWSLTPRVAYRQHHDRFVLDRTQPALYVADHASRSLGAGLGLRGDRTLVGRLALGAEAEWQGLASTSLGDHERIRGGVYLEQSDQVLGLFDWGLGLRLDFGRTEADRDFWFLSPRLGVRLRPFDGLGVTVSAGRGFRLPSFTELYYDSPANQGDPGLPLERAWALELSTRLALLEGLAVRAGGFCRWDSNLVDWQRDAPEQPWRATGTGQMVTGGAEAEIDWQLAGAVDLRAGYARLVFERRAPGADESKYVFRHPLDDAWLLVNAELPWSIGLRASVRYRRRRGEAGEAWVDLRVERRFGPARVWLQGTNLLDRIVEEVPGAPLPGLALMAGAQLSLSGR